MSSLSPQKATPQGPAAERMLPPCWTLSADEKSIARSLKFPNFADALEFVNRLGALAEEANHHPDLKLGWGYVEITFTTHDDGGLSEKDFLMAAKTDALIADA